MNCYNFFGDLSCFRTTAIHFGLGSPQTSHFLQCYTRSYLQQVRYLSVLIFPQITTSERCLRFSSKRGSFACSPSRHHTGDVDRRIAHNQLTRRRYLPYKGSHPASDESFSFDKEVVLPPPETLSLQHKYLLPWVFSKQREQINPKQLKHLARLVFI